MPGDLFRDMFIRLQLVEMLERFVQIQQPVLDATAFGEDTVSVIVNVGIRAEGTLDGGWDEDLPVQEGLADVTEF
jgi:hypothetical protein